MVDFCSQQRCVKRYHFCPHYRDWQVLETLRTRGAILPEKLIRRRDLTRVENLLLTLLHRTRRLMRAPVRLPQTFEELPQRSMPAPHRWHLKSAPRTQLVNRARNQSPSHRHLCHLVPLRRLLLRPIQWMLKQWFHRPFKSGSEHGLPIPLMLFNQTQIQRRHYPTPRVLFVRYLLQHQLRRRRRLQEQPHNPFKIGSGLGSPIPLMLFNLVQI